MLFTTADVISSASAILFPALRLIEACRKRGVLTLVDGAHAPGHVREELVEQICERADFFVGALALKDTLPVFHCCDSRLDELITLTGELFVLVLYSQRCTVGNLHKWFFTSRPCGFLLVSPQFQTQVEPLVTSWYYAKAVAGDWQAPFFMLATHDWTAQFSVLDAIEFCVRAGGIVCFAHFFIATVLSSYH